MKAASGSPRKETQVRRSRKKTSTCRVLCWGPPPGARNFSTACCLVRRYLFLSAHCRRQRHSRVAVVRQCRDSRRPELDSCRRRTDGRPDRRRGRHQRAVRWQKKNGRLPAANRRSENKKPMWKQLRSRLFHGMTRSQLSSPLGSRQLGPLWLGCSRQPKHAPRAVPLPPSARRPGSSRFCLLSPSSLVAIWAVMVALPSPDGAAQGPRRPESCRYASADSHQTQKSAPGLLK